MQKTLTIDYQKLFETLPQAYIAFQADDPTFTIIAQNGAHEVISNTKNADTIGKPLFDVFPDVSAKFKKTGVSDLVESLRRVIATGKPDTMPVLHYDIPISDGEGFANKFWRVTHYPLWGEDGKISAVYQATEDITDKRDTETKLQRTEQQLHEALSSGLIGTWLWDVHKDIVIGDEYMAAMFGVSVEDATEGLPVSRFTNCIHPDDRSRVQKDISKALKNDTVFISEYRTLRTDGSTRWLAARGRIERAKDGSPYHFPGVVIDITERKVLETNLTFLNKAGDILSSSLDYRKTLQNIARLSVQSIADWCSVEILNDQGVLQQVAVSHKDPQKVKWAIELRKQQGPPDLSLPTGLPQVIRSGKPEFYPAIDDAVLVAAAEDEEQLKLLREIGMSAAIVAPLTVGGKTIGGITFISAEQKRHYTEQDLDMAMALSNRASIAITNAGLYDNAQHEIVARKRLEDELRIANEELERRVDERTAQLEDTNLSLQRSNQELQDFAYVASHDLQEPLRKIQAFGNLLEDEYGDKLGDGKDYLQRMRNAAARMSALIEDILSFSRVTTKARGFSPVDLDQIVKGVLDDLETRIEDTHAEIIVGELPTIDADAMQMRQLLQNLIANALKFHKPDEAPIVKIIAKRDISQDKRNKMYTLEIQDNGVGFEEKYLDRIFAVFQRLHNRESYEGTGIGLAVCRKIVERHGGTITAKSRPGKGATFIVTLPVHQKRGERKGDTA
jgi:PAS domain S-box-containing protein